MRKTALLTASLLGWPLAYTNAAPPPEANDARTTTPVKHVIVIYGENRGFDHLFATYRAPSGDKVLNLLSEGIVNADGSPGPNFAAARQYQATDTDVYSVTPVKTEPYATLPPPLAGGPKDASDTKPPFKTIEEARAAGDGLAPEDIKLLMTGGTGLTPKTPDTRIRDVEKLPNGPFLLIPYEAYSANPVHRYYQARQETDCDAAKATAANPSGCQSDLYPWVEVTVGGGTNGKPRPADFNDRTTGEGSTAMGFYNVARGDMPYFTQLAREYTIADNYHQPAMGGTGLDHIIAGFADALWYNDGKGNATTPPANQIENPDPQPGTNNWYKQDGYSGGSYSACADASQPGVGPVLRYLAALPKPVSPNCEPGHYYLLNNYRPAYLGDGSLDSKHEFVTPPVATHSISDVLLDGHVSFAWYGESWNRHAAGEKEDPNWFCDICAPMAYQTRFMTDAALRGRVLKDTTDLYADLKAGTLPAVTFVKPGGMNDGHPGSSKFSLFEAFTRNVLTELRKHPKLRADTAVFITVDEAGGYWDTGYIQPLDFFGDGPRIPLIVVSPWTHGGHVSHQYSDHVSVLKFIEANWKLPAISSRSRDNMPNPVQNAANPYVPVNTPAIGDLMAMFQFPRRH